MKKANLTGVWSGHYTYPHTHGPVSFVATLIETPSWLSGSTHEICTMGERAGETIYATLSGERSGSLVRFLKSYEASDLYYKVAYDGVLNGDATEISGRWTIPGCWSGSFVMVRSGGSSVKIARKAAERV